MFEIAQIRREPRLWPTPPRRATLPGLEPADSEFGTVPAASLLRLLEIFQIGRRLILPGRHQIAVRTQHIALAPDVDELLALGANILDPDRPRIGVAAIGLIHGPRPRQSMI